MVGVPGRSKGCHACRKQKIKCSQEHPECSNCHRVGRPCPGYERDRIFIHLAPPEKDSKTGKPEAKRRESFKRSIGCSLQRQMIPNEGVPAPKPPSNNAAMRPARDSLAPSTAWIQPQQSLRRSAYRQQLLGTFLSRFEPQPHQRSPSLAQRHWLTFITGRPALSQALDVAAVAVCTAKLGRVSRDPGLLTESLRLYGRGLRELQYALYDPHQMYSDDTLGACILLAMYEVYECPSRSYTGYKSHVTGCGHLIEMRGPEAHAEGLGHWIFQSFRFMASLEALATKHTFLESAIWKTVPFQNHIKSPFNQLLDLLLEAPAILRQSDALQDLPTLTEKFHGALSLLYTLNDLESRMTLSYAVLERIMPGPLYTERGTEPDALNTRELFPTLIQFDDVRTAGTLMLYWACQTMLGSGRAKLIPLVAYLQSAAGLAPPQPSPMQDASGPNFNGTRTPDSNGSAAASVELASHPSPLPLAAEAVDFATHARKVCKGALYCLTIEDSELGLGAMTAPLHIVLDVFRSWDDSYRAECGWIQGVLGLAKKRGMGIITFLEGMASSDG